MKGSDIDQKQEGNTQAMFFCFCNSMRTKSWTKSQAKASLKINNEKDFVYVDIYVCSFVFIEGRASEIIDKKKVEVGKQKSTFKELSKLSSTIFLIFYTVIVALYQIILKIFLLSPGKKKS